MFSELRGSDDVFVIAEVGQNHQGDLETAKEFIRIFAAAGASAIKFQTRNNKYLFSPEAYDAPYNSENAFGDSYGAHREKLELNPDWLPDLKAECADSGVRFMSTAFDEPSLDLLLSVGVDALKLASFDAGNIPFIAKVASAGVPTVLSTGGANWQQIIDSAETLSSVCDDAAILHCVSEYPCRPEHLGLEKVKLMGQQFETLTPGLSDHYNGTLSGPIAFMMGARVFEKHVTLNRAWKGTDHSFSLEPEGFRKFVRDLARTPEMLPALPDSALGNEAVFLKLGKSLVASKSMRAGEAIGIDNLSGRIFSKLGTPVRESKLFIGKTVTRNVNAGEKLDQSWFE